jgi:hypothetical protein
MFKRLATIVGAIALVSLLGLFAIGSVLAEGPTPTPVPQTPWNGAWGRVCQGAGVVSDAVGKLLGLTPEQIYAERQAGKTLAQVAKDKGITDQQLIDAIVAGRTEEIAQAVKDGRMTQAQADWMLAKMKAMAPFQITNPFGPGGMRGRMGGGMGGGMRGGGFHTGAAPWATPTQ